MTAAEIARVLGGRRTTDGYMCRCPVPSHGSGRGDRSPSLLVKDGDHAPLFTCFAGCDRRDVVDVLRRRGLLEDRDRDVATRRRVAVRQTTPTWSHDPDPDALRIWRDAKPAAGSVVETYLNSRGITNAIPPSLRCGERLHLDRYRLPTMVAAVTTPGNTIIAVQTLLLTTAGRKASVSLPRITTGALGAGAVWLAKTTEVLGLAEGIETALLAMQLSGVPCWASLGGGRMARVAIPDSVRELHIFGDNDGPGRAAAYRVAAAHNGRHVVLRFPKDAKDWNDVLIARGRTAA
jgi:putative DNA primase/helicase